MPHNITPINDTTYKLTPKDDPKDRIEIEIGDIKEKDFKPQVKLMRWDNEVNFSIRLTENGTETSKVSLKDDKVTWDKGNFKIESYEAENAFKYVWYLKEKPATNKVQFSIQSKGLDFFYQPPLTQEYQNGYSEEFQREIFVTETQVKDLDENVLVERPENVVGSYAVYHKTKGGMNDINGMEYKVGKAFHIYRPRLKDSNGWEVWGDLHIENGLYEITIPEDFYNNAVYPIKSNDRFGYESEAETAESPHYTYIRGNKATGGVGTLSKISVYLKGYDATIEVKVALYKDSDDSLVDYQSSEGSVGTTASFIDIDVNNSAGITSIDYRLLVIGSEGNTDSRQATYYYDSLSSIYYYISVTYADLWASTFSPYSSSNNKYSIYATYTAGGASGPANLKTINAITKANIKSINGILIANIKSVNAIL